MIPRNSIRRHDAAEQLEERMWDLEDGQEEENGDGDVEEVLQVWLARRDADEHGSEWERDEKAGNQLVRIQSRSAGYACGDNKAIPLSGRWMHQLLAQEGQTTRPCPPCRRRTVFI